MKRRSAAQSNKAPVPDPPIPASETQVPDDDFPDIPDESMMAMIRVLKIKAELGVPSAKDALKQIRAILLS